MRQCVLDAQHGAGHKHILHSPHNRQDEPQEEAPHPTFPPTPGSCRLSSSKSPPVTLWFGSRVTVTSSGWQSLPAGHLGPQELAVFLLTKGARNPSGATTGRPPRGSRRL